MNNSKHKLEEKQGWGMVGFLELDVAKMLMGLA
jgi:hypothetical protein